MQKKLDNKASCPCCSGQTYQQCCGQFLSTKAFPRTPLALMRSRYTAHVINDIDYIIQTMKGKAAKLFDRHATEQEWFQNRKWLKLEIVEAPVVKSKDNQGIVEFKAYFELEGSEHMMHERSKFSKLNDRWYYVSGKHKQDTPHQQVKINRNDLCPCGSGKKYKHCCL